MRLSMKMLKQVPLQVPLSAIKMEVFNIPLRSPREKIIFVMGATGTGKSRLSIDLANHFPAEIINSDKIQVHKGLDIVTNKVTKEEKRGIPHHLLGIVNPNVDFTKKDFCHRADHAVQSILSRHKIPIIVGGSNSYIEALVDNRYNGLSSRYDCCFLWVDVCSSVLNNFLSYRVDKMIEAGMVDELRTFFDPNVSKEDYSRGIRKAIGVPEFDDYLRNELCLDQESRTRMFNEAIDRVKDNNRKLATRQLDKIDRLRHKRGWDLHRLDATSVFQKHMWNSAAATDEAWNKLVTRPSTKIVTQFLDSYHPSSTTTFTTGGLAAGMRSSRTAIIAAP